MMDNGFEVNIFITIITPLTENPMTLNRISRKVHIFALSVKVSEQMFSTLLGLITTNVMYIFYL